MLTRNGYLLDKKKYNNNFLKVLKEDLTVEPFIPDDYKFGQDDQLKFPVYKENKDYLAIPRMYGIEKIGKPKINFGSKNKAKIKFTGKLREYQTKIVDTVLPLIKKEGGGMLSIPPGRGKTVLAIYLASKLKVKVLVLVHKTFLMEQWKERIEMFTNSSVGKIQRDTVDVNDHDFVIGMIQSISMKDTYDPELFHMFDFIIIDEAHHISSKVFSQSLLKMCSPYMLGLSATFRRSDRLEKVFNWHVGRMLYMDKELVECDKLVKRYFYSVKHPYYREYINRYNGKANLAKMYTKLLDVPDRNNFVMKLVTDIYKKRKGTKGLLLSQRIDDIKRIKKFLDKETNIISAEFHGQTKPAQREQATKAELILSVYQFASEALDIPDLNCLIMVQSKKDLEQVLGRIFRKQKGQYTTVPLVIDIIDELPPFKRQASVRNRKYKKDKFVVEDYIYNAETKKVTFKCKKDYSKFEEVKLKKPVDRFLDE